MVMTPSLPTLSIASAIFLPISSSPLALMDPTCAISSLFAISRDIFCRPATTDSTARSMPRFRSMGLWPAATSLEPVR